jgi:hypothetical protein
MWAQLEHSVQPTSKGATLTYRVARRLLSAASAYYHNDLATTYPHQATLEQHHVRISRQISPTDSLLFTMQGKSMARCMGTSSKPSWALSHVHIAYINTALDTAFLLSNEQAFWHELGYVRQLVGLPRMASRRRNYRLYRHHCWHLESS